MIVSPVEYEFMIAARETELTSMKVQMRQLAVEGLGSEQDVRVIGEGRFARVRRALQAARQAYATPAGAEPAQG